MKILPATVDEGSVPGEGVSQRMKLRRAATPGSTRRFFTASPAADARRTMHAAASPFPSVKSVKAMKQTKM
jgi:hypothetical protein